MAAGKGLQGQRCVYAKKTTENTSTWAKRSVHTPEGSKDGVPELPCEQRKGRLRDGVAASARDFSAGRKQRRLCDRRWRGRQREAHLLRRSAQLILLDRHRWMNVTRYVEINATIQALAAHTLWLLLDTRFNSF